MNLRDSTGAPEHLNARTYSAPDIKFAAVSHNSVLYTPAFIRRHACSDNHGDFAKPRRRPSPSLCARLKSILFAVANIVF
jgi:hypothetical protein